jgi:hypothetical protein
MGIVVSYLAVALQEEPHLWSNDEHAHEEANIPTPSYEQPTDDIVSSSPSTRKSDTVSYNDVMQYRSIRWSVANAITETKDVDIGIIVPHSFPISHKDVIDGSPFPYCRGSIVDYGGYTLHQDEFVVALIRCFNPCHFSSSSPFREKILHIAYQIIDDMVKFRVVAEALKRHIETLDPHVVGTRQTLQLQGSRQSNVCLVEKFSSGLDSQA